MVLIEGGTFRSKKRKIPSFQLARYPVSLALWEKVMGRHQQGYFQHPLLPVESVSWNDCKTFIVKLNDELEASFRLPTMNEWMYAAQARATIDKKMKYAGSNDASEVSWEKKNDFSHLHNGRTKLPNPNGLIGMSGGISEWCSDIQTDSHEEYGPNGLEWKAFGPYYSAIGKGRIGTHIGTSPSNPSKRIGLRLVRNKN
ncbi:formylglycine-generating enzyme family protein [Pontibacter sp. G13]|uniref:formylglycine-generating enzyme family protein n=1 Tax=Pontibacter sp. G13 TaxID=3074898 RepID=UPI00288C4C2C|nr:formylglycine-generating enzyme family protein [Pontibacter sp. G13]WNJ21516.1 formylglycine-generating enzyme family protein [Pontibacter sp. G13]